MLSAFSQPTGARLPPVSYASRHRIAAEASGRTRPDPSPPHSDVVIVSGSYGAGHDAVADELMRRLRGRGLTVRRLDIVELLPLGVGRALRWLYFTQLRIVPGLWGTTLRFLEPDGTASRATRWLLGIIGRQLVSAVRGGGAVVSTHPFASQILGEARARGRLLTAAITYLTDASVHRLWVHPHIDHHLAIHEVAANQARGLGGRASVISPVIRSHGAVALDPSWTPPWSPETPIALVVGGSCGVGELAETAREILSTGLATPVVACGTNQRLRLSVAAIPGAVALGWRDDLPRLIEAADCVVQNAGGMTALEALAAGTPTLTYRAIPGHGATNAEALDRAGWIPWVRDRSQLRLALETALSSPSSGKLMTGAPDPADVVIALLGKPAAPIAGVA